MAATVEQTAAGNLDLLEHRVAQELLASTRLARLAYTWFDGSPRVVPLWFHWDGSAIVIGTPAKAPKLAALEASSRVAVTIDGDSFPYHVLSVRGTAVVEHLDDVAPEYVAAAVRYFGPDQGTAWTDGLRGRPMGRIRITPEWVNVLDFERRLPSALSS
ncbi:pyridoxamine 5'-phosphate oxidase family protein [uncultured Friedmanniella sp.]|uniref:pyridoxamine 5'-phosphate oxidase family protein n=1 Tax=uncultured Friedmanniella sp. TaxID=335381 RepID=UPI0035CA2360